MSHTEYASRVPGFFEFSGFVDELFPVSWESMFSGMRYVSSTRKAEGEEFWPGEVSFVIISIKIHESVFIVTQVTNTRDDTPV
jgi:hypothetical protein